MKDNMLDVIELMVAQTQADIFEKTKNMGLDSENFIRLFMNSETCRQLDMNYSHMCFAGEAYVTEEFMDESKDKIIKSDNTFSEDELYWIGFIYRFWHYYTGESSARIYEQADANMLYTIYPGYHTLDCRVAVDRIKEANALKQKP